MRTSDVSFILAVLITLVATAMFTDKSKVNDELIFGGPPFSKVKPILKDRCSRCHYSGTQDWTEYENAKAKKVAIRHRVWITRSMPLGAPMPEYEREAIKNWIDGGTQP